MVIFVLAALLAFFATAPLFQPEGRQALQDQPMRQFWIAAAVLIALLFLLIGQSFVPPSQLSGVLAWIGVFAAVALISFFVIYAAATRDQHLLLWCSFGSLIAGLIAIPFLLVGQSFVPPNQLPGVLAWVGVFAAVSLISFAAIYVAATRVQHLLRWCAFGSLIAGLIAILFLLAGQSFVPPSQLLGVLAWIGVFAVVGLISFAAIYAAATRVQHLLLWCAFGSLIAGLIAILFLLVGQSFVPPSQLPDVLAWIGAFAAVSLISFAAIYAVAAMVPRLLPWPAFGALIVGLIAVGAWLIVSPPTQWGRGLAIYIDLWRISEVDVVRAILGATVGALLRYWMIAPVASEISVDGKLPAWWRRRTAGIATALSFLLLLAVIAPKLKQLSSLDTPFGGAQFETLAAPGNRLIFEVERESEIDASLWGILGLTFRIEQDINYMNETGSSINPRGNQPADLEAYKATKRFIERIVDPLARCAMIAVGEYTDKETVRGIIRPAFREFQKLLDLAVTNPSRAGVQAHKHFLQTVATAQTTLRAAVDRRDDCKDPSLIWHAYPERYRPKFGPPKPFMRELAKSPHTYLALAHFLWFNRNLEGATALLEHNVASFSYSMNFNLTLGAYLYHSERDPTEYLPRYQDALDKATRLAGEVQRELGTPGISVPTYDTLKKLEQRYEKAILIIKKRIAYKAARAGEWEVRAKLFAEDIAGNLNIFEGGEKSAYIDTVGYVMMAFAARKSEPNFGDIEAARKLFREALILAKNELVLVKNELVQIPAKLTKKRAMAVSKQEAMRTIIRIIRTHLEQAETLLKQP